MLKKPDSPSRDLLCRCHGFSLAFACQGGGPPEIRAERVVMVSYDSLGADLAWGWIADGTVSSPDGLAGMAQQGFSAERLRMVDPTLTAVNHISLAAGRNAAGTGVVSNAFHRPGHADHRMGFRVQCLE